MKNHYTLRKIIALLLTFALMAVCCIAPVASAEDSPGFYTIYLETQGGVGTATQVYAYKGTWTGYRVSSFPIPTMTGYKFEGWYDDAVGGEEVDDEYEFISDTTIFAHWIPDGSVSQTTAQTVTVTDTDTEDATAETGFALKDHLGTVVAITGLTLVAFAVASAN